MRYDVVNRPKHYASGGIECIDFTKALIKPYSGIVAGCMQNVVKYTWRAHDKNGVEDIAKAEWYLSYTLHEMNALRVRSPKVVCPYCDVNAFRNEEENELMRRGMEQLGKNLSSKEREYMNVLYRHIASGFDDPRAGTESLKALASWEKCFGNKRVRTENVSHPKHYAGNVECIDYLNVMVTPYNGIVAACMQNALKYTWRTHGKNGVEDVKKAAWYLDYADKEINRQMDLYRDKGILPSFVSGVSHELTKGELALRREGFLQVMDSLKGREREYYTAVYEGIRDGRFVMDSCRRDAMNAVKDWSRHYVRSVTDLSANQDSQADRNKNRGVKR